jgi:uncharacterized protein (TIGR03032 family)
MIEAGTMSARPVELTALPSAWERQATASRGLFSWLIRQRISLVTSANDTGQLFFIGADEKKGIVFSQAKFSAAAMGLSVFPQRLYLATRNQIWRLENALNTNHLANDRFDRLYVPRNSQVTGDFDVHEMAVEDTGRIVDAAFAATARRPPVGAEFRLRPSAAHRPRDRRA